MADRIDTRLIEETHSFGHHTYLYEEASGPGIRLEVGRIYDDKQGIWCEISAFRTYPNHNGEPVAPRELLSPKRTNLLGNWKAVAKELNELTEDLYFFDVMVDEVVKKTVSTHREGLPPSPLPDIWHDTKLEDIFLLPPFVAKEGVSVLFATGGTGKSTLAAAMAIAIAGWQPIWGEFPTMQGHVLYLDYESTPDAMTRNVFALLKGFGMTRDMLRYQIYHEPMNARVLTEIHRIRKRVREMDIKFVILDSVGMGRGGDHVGAQDTIDLFRALNSLGVPVLALDHTTKQDRRDGTLLTPYGSQYTENSARMVWGMQESDESTPLRRLLTMHNTKLNVGRRHEPVTMVMEYLNNDEGMTDAIKTEVLYEVLISQTKSTTHDSICRLMEEAPEKWWTLRELAQRSGLKLSSIEKSMERHRDMFGTKKIGKSNAFRPSWVEEDDMEVIG